MLTFNAGDDLLQYDLHSLGVDVDVDGLDGRAARDGGAHIGELFLKLLPQPIERVHLRSFRDLNLKAHSRKPFTERDTSNTSNLGTLPALHLVKQ